MSTLQGNTTTIENLLRSVNNLPNVGADDAVLYIDQTLTDAQKAQARTNIGAASADEVAGKMDKVTGTEDQVIGFDADGNPVAREAPSGGGGVQPDWNQSDPDAADFVKNRPFYEFENVTEIIPEAEMTGFDDGGLYVIPLDQSQFTEKEETLKITFDGTPYICQKIEGMFFGNAGIMGAGEDTGEPFVFMLGFGSATFFVLDAEPHMIGISNYSVSVKRIDDKFIGAEWVARTEETEVSLLSNASVALTSDTSGSAERFVHIIEKMDYELYDLIARKDVVVTWNGTEYTYYATAVNASSTFVKPGDILIGNLYLGASGIYNDNGMPFMLQLRRDSRYVTLTIWGEAAGTATVSAKFTAPVQNKIAIEHLPELKPYKLPGAVYAGEIDWAETDETKPGYIKNKPFGDVETVLYEGANLEPTLDSGAYMLMTTADFEFVEGQQYTVTLDGVEYVTEAFMIYGVYPGLGNPALIGAGDDNGMPFITGVGLMTPGEMVFMGTTVFSSLSILTVQPKRIDAKYAPLPVVYLYRDTEKYLYATGDTSDTNNRLTIAELRSIVASGKVIYVVDSYWNCLATSIYTAGTYGVVSVIDFSSDKTVRFYTAEYTAS